MLLKEGYFKVAGNPYEKKKKPDASEESTGENAGNPAESSFGLEFLDVLNRLKKGMELPVQGLAIREGETSPPKRYNSGSMILAMENAGQLIEDEELRAQIKGSGIGTSATRAEIIKKLVRIGYLHLNKKSQILSPEVLGEMVYEVVNMTVPALLNPKMTA